MTATGPAGSPALTAAWPVRSGAVPPIADGFSARPESAPDLGAALTPGTTVVLGPGRVPEAGLPDWLSSCGKTQLAVYFAESMWRARQLDLLVWVVAASRASILSGYVEAAAAIKSDHVGDAESVASHFVNWLSETNRSWLVVLDDLRSVEDIKGLWPGGSAGRTLITTTNTADVPGDRPAHALPLREFSTREAMSYLMGRLTADPDQRIGAIDLVADLGCEPPALFQASAVIASSGLSCRDYRDFFAQRRAQLAEAADHQRAAAAVTWTISVEQAERLSPGGGAQYLLALAALLDGQGIPGQVFTASATCAYLSAGTGSPIDASRSWRALLSLERVGLLVVDPATSPPTARMGSVLQAAIRAATPKRIAERAARAVADALLEVWPAEEPEAWLAESLRSCSASLRYAAGDGLWSGGSIHPLLVRAGRSLDKARMTGPAVTYWRELAAANDRILGSSSADTLTAGSRLAAALMAAGQTAEAVAWGQWVLAGRARLLGRDHPETIAARIELGRAFVAASQPEAALPILEEAAGECERVLGADHLDTLAARDELAIACRSAGKTDEAIRLYRRTLPDRERVQGARHLDTMTTRQRLAEAYLAEGRVKDAISQLKRLLSDREKVQGPDHLDTIVARGSLASAYHSAGRMATAVQLYEQACQGYERVLGPDAPETLARRANLAHAYYTVGRLSDATATLRDTVDRCERTLPPGDPLTKTVRESLTNIAGE
ncbi:MAG TPA: tetratricopeptide repeat protein [Streptosporangiaceae bacterium]|nr:tetratricopeptide repeat protein [Streptosporangiaceae bacterium]